MNLYALCSALTCILNANGKGAAFADLNFFGRQFLDRDRWALDSLKQTLTWAAGAEARVIDGQVGS